MRKIATLIMFFFFTVAQVWAQDRTVKGKVTGDDGKPAVGVTVSAGKSKVSTDNNGNYTIQVAANVTKLEFSGANINAISVPVTSSNSYDVAVQTAVNTMNEVFVSTGYQSVSKKVFSGATAKVKSEAFEDKPVLSFDQALAGKASGVQVVTSSGLVGDNVVIRVRGTGSISSGSQPLIVIDGVIITQGNLGQLYNPANALADLNPADIENIEILKDAGSAAIYGSLGSNGVLLITTKKGKSGTAVLNYDTYVGFVNPANKIRVLNSDEYTSTINKLRTNASLPLMAFNGDYNGDGIPDPVNTDWQKASINQGFTQNHQITASGGTPKGTYYASVNYNDIQNYITANRQTRGSVRLNITSKVNDKLEIGMRTQFSKTKSFGLGSGTGGALSGYPFGALTMYPNIPVYNPTNGDYYLGQGGNTTAINTPNPVAVQDLNRDIRVSNRFLGSLYADLTIARNFKLRSQIATDYLSSNNDQFWNERVGDGQGLSGVAQSVYADLYAWTWSNTLTFNKNYGNHSVNALVGYEAFRTFGKDAYAFGITLNDPRFTALTPNNYQTTGATNSTPTNGDANNGRESVFGSVNYSFKNKYSLSASLRRDAASQFGVDSRFGSFPGISASWRVTEEKFMRGSSKWLTDLKIRASYGVTGNTSISEFGARQFWAPSQYADIGIPTFNLNQVGNSGLRWERSEQTNIGFDASIGKKGFTVSMDYYVKNALDLVLNNPIPTTAGLGTTLLQNIGKIQNTGVELTISTPVVNKKKFVWEVNFNVAYSRNKIIYFNDVNGQLTGGYSIAKAGFDLGAAFLIRWAGVNSVNGLPQFLDVNGNVKQYDHSQTAINRWTDPKSGAVVSAVTAADRVIDNDKTPYPKFFGGLSQTFKFGNVDLVADLQFSFDFYVYNNTKSLLMNYSNNRNKSAEILNAWTTPGQVTDVPRLFWGDPQFTSLSTRWLERADFVRLRNLQIGYNFPKTVLTKLGLSKLRFYVAGSNLLTLTKYTGIDPEANANGNTNIGFGVDLVRPYLARTIQMGFNVGF